MTTEVDLAFQPLHRCKWWLSDDRASSNPLTDNKCKCRLTPCYSIVAAFLVLKIPLHPYKWYNRHRDRPTNGLSPFLANEKDFLRLFQKGV